jgi:hypothetical protein
MEHSKSPPPSGSIDRESREPPDEPGNQRKAQAVWLVGGLILVLLTIYLSSLNASNWIGVVVFSIGVGSILLGFPPLQRIKIVDFLWGRVGIISQWLRVNRHQFPLIVFGLTLSLASYAAAGDFYVALSPWHVQMWVVGAALLLLGCWQPIKFDSFFRSNWRELIIVALLTGLGFIARSVYIENIPYSMTGDEGGTGLYALDYMIGKLDNILNVAWFSFPSFYFWLVSNFVKMFGRTVAAIRFLSVIGGTLGVVAIYWTVRVMFSRNLAVLSAIFMGAFHFHLLFSRIAIANIWDSTLMTFMIGALWVAWKRNDRWAFLLAGLTMGLGQYFYTTSRLMPVYAVLWLVVLFRRSPVKDRTAGLVCLSLTFIVVTLPLALFYMNNPSDFFSPMQRVSIFSHDWFSNTSQATGLTPAQLVLDQLKKTILGFSINELDGVYNPDSPMLLTAPAMLFHVGVILTFFRIRDPRFSIIVIGMLGPVLTGTFSFEPPNSQRLLFAAPWVVILVTLPLEEIRTQLQKAWPKFLRLGTAVVLVFGLLLAFIELRFFFLEAMPERQYSDHKAYLARAIGEYIRELEEPTQVYFLKDPGMSYFALSSLPYLADNAVGRDIELPLDAPSNPSITGDNIVFIALPQTNDVMEQIKGLYPGGEIFVQPDQDGSILFSSYRLKN